MTWTFSHLCLSPVWTTVTMLLVDGEEAS